LVCPAFFALHQAAMSFSSRSWFFSLAVQYHPPSRRHMVTKLSQLMVMIEAGDWFAAIKFAAKFPDLGSERDSILRAKDAIHNPDFYRQIKRDPESLIEAGKDALRRRYPLR
jgi:hypothetical protein